jgi:cell division initiation protein
MTTSEIQHSDALEVSVGGALAQRLTPDGVRRLEFPRTPIGRRGYNESDVEHFRTRVVHEIVQSNNERASLRQELQRNRDEVKRLRDYFREHRVDVDAGAGQAGGSGQTTVQNAPSATTQINVNIATVQAVNVMAQAQQAADQHIAQAEDYARRLVANARLQYEEILQRAHDQAQEAAAEAGRQYEQQNQEKQQEQQKQLEAPDTRTSPEQSPERSPEHAAEMQQLQERLAYMRTFAQVTQVQLRSILDALRQELDQLTDLPQGPATPAVSATAAVPAGATRAELPQRR